jgi:hypothetical protein
VKIGQINLISKSFNMANVCSTHGTGYKIFVTKPEGKRQLGRPRHRWETNIKMEIREIKFGGIDLINIRIVTSKSLL